MRRNITGPRDDDEVDIREEDKRRFLRLYEKTPVRSEIVGFPPRSDGSVQSCTAEDLVARISHFAAPVSGTPTRFCAFCASFVSIRASSFSGVSRDRTNNNFYNNNNNNIKLTYRLLYSMDIGFF